MRQLETIILIKSYFSTREIVIDRNEHRFPISKEHDSVQAIFLVFPWFRVEYLLEELWSGVSDDT